MLDRRHTLPIAGLVAVPMLVACGPRAGESVESGGSDGTGAATTEAGSDSATATGPLGMACGADGIAPGPVGIRTNHDAAALSGCTVIDGDLFIDPCRLCFPQTKPGCFQCDDPQALTSISGLDRLEHVTGSVFVGWDGDVADNEDRTGPEALASIAELEALREVDGDLHLGYAPLVQSAAFPVLERVGGELLVADSFTTEPTFPALREVAALHLAGPARNSFDFPSLELAGSLWLYETHLASVEGAPKLADLGRLVVTDDDEISDLSPLLGVPSVSVTIQSLAKVTTLDLIHAGPASSIGAANCPALERVSIPADVEAIAGLSLGDNDALATIALAGVTEISSFEVWSNDALGSLDGVASLQHVTGSDFRISNNPGLCQSEVDAFAEGLTFTDEIWVWDLDGNGDC